MLLDHLLSRVGRRLCQMAEEGQASCPPAGRGGARRASRTEPGARPPVRWWPACP